MLVKINLNPNKKIVFFICPNHLTISVLWILQTIWKVCLKVKIIILLTKTKIDKLTFKLLKLKLNCKLWLDKLWSGIIFNLKKVKLKKNKNLMLIQRLMDYLAMLHAQLQGDFLEREDKGSMKNILKILNRITRHWMNKKQKLRKVRLLKAGRNYLKFKTIYKIWLKSIKCSWRYLKKYILKSKAS